MPMDFSFAEQPKKEIKKERKEKRKGYSIPKTKDFILWMEGLDPTRYPDCDGLIKRYSIHGRKSFILDLFRLLEYFIDEHKT